MKTRDWADVDFYAALGVASDARPEEISAAYRTLAKQLHPDRFGAQSAAGARFVEVTTAYEVLSDSSRRHDYDAIRARRVAGEAPSVVAAPRPMGTVPRPPAAPTTRWTPRRARAAIAGGVLCAIGGIAFGVFILSLQASERRDRAARTEVYATIAHGEPDARLAYQPATAQRPYVADVPASFAGAIGDAREIQVAFRPDAADRMTLVDLAPETWTGRATATVVHAVGPVQITFLVPGAAAPTVVDEPDRTNGGRLFDGAQVRVLFDPDDPTDVRLAESTAGRDLTFWFVAVKLMVAGPILAGFGATRLRRTPRGTRD